MIEDVERIIGTVGFPIAMCVLIIFTTNKKLDCLTKAIQELTNYMRGVNNGRRKS